jgi:hypothetical protein
LATVSIKVLVRDDPPERLCCYDRKSPVFLAQYPQGVAMSQGKMFMGAPPQQQGYPQAVGMAPMGHAYAGQPMQPPVGQAPQAPQEHAGEDQDERLLPAS